MINMFKYITSVEINKDLPEKLVTLLLEPKPDFELTSWYPPTFLAFLLILWP